MRRLLFQSACVAAFLCVNTNASAKDLQGFHYEHDGGIQTDRGLFTFQLHNGFLTITHIAERWRGFDVHTPRTEITLPKAALSFFITFGDQTFLVHADQLKQNAINRFDLGGAVGRVSVEPFITNQNIDLIGESEAIEVTGEPSSQDRSLPVDTLPKATVIKHSPKGPVEMQLPILVEHSLFKMRSEPQRQAVFSYEHQSSNQPDGRFVVELVGKELRVKHITEPPMGFETKPSIRPTSAPVSILLRHKDGHFLVTAQDLMVRGELTYVLPSAFAKLEVSLPGMADTPYMLDVNEINLSNQNRRAKTALESRSYYLGSSEAGDVVVLGAAEMRSEAAPGRTLGLNYESHGTGTKGLGRFEFELQGRYLVIRHFARNAFALSDLVEGPVEFDPRFKIISPSLRVNLEIPGEAFRAGEVRIALPKKLKGKLEVVVPHDMDRALFEKSAGFLTGSGCSGTFGR